jgi:eukaryotic-like serine/threonine-protein kinase
MIPERWDEIKDKLQAALELQPSERPAYLASVANPDLRQELESLLASHDKAGTDFLSPTRGVSKIDAAGVSGNSLGKRIGAYQIVEEIGSGGMGEVYRAFRIDDEYQKQVAIKLVRAGQDSGFVVSRFKNERQIMASLDHPNIARLFDGGTTEEGVPYFVMELIEGEPIDEYCHHGQLPVPERLKLFLQICSAVQYAHQRLIIHRDIKPGNILVTSGGVPKLLDFGIAKILDTDAVTGRFEPTLTVFRVMTPGYASPEQVKGEAITTASDVYSLGVVLYELLTGCHPYRRADSTPQEVARAACETEPEKPSNAVRRSKPVSGPDAAQPGPPAPKPAGDSVEKLSKKLRGDLDNIILMALRKEPQRRYESVEQFAGDIRRHLENLPVIARKDTARYRTGKFITRHKAGVAAAIAVMVSLAGGLAVSTYEAHIARTQQQRAEQNFKDVRELANSLIFTVRDDIHELAGSTPVEARIVQTGLQYLDRLAAQASGNTALLRELAAAYRRLGDAQGTPNDSNLGDPAGALISYRKALHIREELANRESASTADRLDLASTYRIIGQLMQQMGDLNEAADDIHKALAITQEVVNVQQGEPEAFHELYQDFIALANLDGDDLGTGPWGDPFRALTDHRNALEAVRRWAQLKPQERLPRRCIAYTQNQIAADLVRGGRLDEAQKAAREALAILEQLSASSASTSNALQNLAAYSHTQLGDALLFSGNTAGAIAQYEAAVRIREENARRNPKEFFGGILLGLSDFDLGRGLLVSNRKSFALHTIRKGIVLEEQKVSSNPKRPDLLLFFATGQVLQGEALEAMRREEDALQSYEKGSKLLESAALNGQKNVALVACLAAARVKGAAALAKLGRLDQARDDYEKMLVIVQPLSMESVGSLEARYVMAEIYTGLGNLAGHREIGEGGSSKEACEFYRKALAVWEQLPINTVLPPSRFGVISRARMKGRLDGCGRALASHSSTLRLVPQEQQSRLQ